MHIFTIASLSGRPAPVASLSIAGAARAGGTASRWLLLALLLGLLTPAWAQPAFTTSHSTGITYTSIGTTGASFTFAGSSTDDNLSASVALPTGFAFTYLGTPITSFEACTNGWLSLNGTTTSAEYQNALGSDTNASYSTASATMVLAPFWEDLVCQGNNNTTASLAASLKYLVTGTAPNRVLTVEWLGVEVYGNAGPNLNFQVKLYETTNVIQYQYGIMSGFNGANNYNYTYSLGLNGSPPSASYLAQQTPNSNYFAQAGGTTVNTAANGMNTVPQSYSQLQFVPSASLSTGTAPTATVPANNEPAGAFTVPIVFYSPTTFATTYTSANATASAGITACSATTPGTPDDDVWFKFTLTSTQNITVTLRGSGGYDGVLQVFSNAGTTALGCVNATGAGLEEDYNTALPAGTYYVRVYEAGTGSGTTGQFALAVYATPTPPPNNECTTAVALTSAGSCTPVTGTSLGGTASASVPPTCSGTPDDDVWYSFTTAATARTYTLTMQSGADFDGVMQVLSGTCGTYTSVSCANTTLSGGAEVITLSGLTTSTTYYVRVYEFDPGAGSGDFTICLTDNLPHISSFTPITGPVGTSVTLTGTSLTGATSVSFNGTVQATITGSSATGLTVAVPAGATTGLLTVTTPVGTSTASSQTFTVVPPPTITAAAPTPGGLGQSITLTGTGLGSPTALTINGANALPNIISNSGTSLVVRVPATATASGSVSISTANGTATSAFTVMAAPGNALAFDGTNDYLSLPAGLNTANFTFEAWVNYQDNGTWSRIFDFGTGQTTWMILGPKSGYAAPYANNLHFSITTTGGGGGESTILSTTPMPVGRWQHVAVTLATTGGVTSGTLYLNGQVIGTNANLPISPASLGTLTNNWLGRSQYADPYLKGSLDEVRIWNTARTQAQVQADMLAPAAAPFPTGLQFYLNTDQGTPATASTGANTAYTTLYDLVSAQLATLNNFALTSGTTTSNYVESYAMVVPTATAASALSGTGFTANWTAPALGTVDNGYHLDVSTSSTFASAITGSPFTVSSGTSQAVTGLTTGTTYYYRVRADKTSVTGQGGPSNVISVVPCPAPVATAQNVSAPLDVTSTATVTAAQVNNGSTANCGAAAVGALSLQKFVTGVISGEVGEGGTLTLTAPNGGIFTAINFASYGTPTGSAGSYTTGGCNSTTSVAVVSAALLGNSSGSIGANNTTFGDPCNGTVKKLAVTATYEYYSAAATAATSVTYTCANVGVHYVMLTVTSVSGATSQAQAKVTVSVPATPTTTWSGASSTDWTDCANWSYGQVPTAAISAIIPTSQPYYPSLTTGTFPVLNLTIATGGSLTVASGATLAINGNFANNGTATLSGPVQFVGSAATQTLGGSTSTPFTTLVVNKTSGTVQLGQNLTINSGLTMSGGTLTTTSSYQANLGSSASLSESETSYVLGKVVVSRTLAAGTAESFSGLGLTLTPAAGLVAPGTTLVTRNTGTAIAGAGTSQSILRAFVIAPATNAGLNVTLAFTYFTHELNGIAPGNLALFKSVSGGTPWIPQHPITLGANMVTKTGITDFSTWTLGSAANPLPVELAAFTATAEGNTSVRLAWTTASEQHSARFEVERSTNSVAFERIGTVAGQGIKATATDYALLDTQLPSHSLTLYYRLRQVDLDGTATYSPVRSVSLSEAAAGLALFPNPAHSAATLTGTRPGTVVTVYDALGRLVTMAPADATGTAALALPAGLPAGVYVVRAGTQALRLTVE